MDNFHTRAPFIPEPAATPLNPHTGAMQQDAAANTEENNGLQQDAAAPPLYETATHDYTISVDQIRARLAERGLSKSKDTIQRWCRSGDLDCKKQGFLNRYFTNEKSLLSLEERLLPDMVADRIGESNPNVQLHQAVDEKKADGVKADAAANEGERTGMRVQPAESADAHSGIQEDVPVDAAARSGTPEHLGMREENASLKAEVKVLREMIGKFEKFADQAVEDKQLTLETFQTMALGGRLERRTSGATDGEVIHATTPDDHPQRR